MDKAKSSVETAPSERLKIRLESLSASDTALLGRCEDLEKICASLSRSHDNPGLCLCTHLLPEAKKSASQKQYPSSGRRSRKGNGAMSEPHPDQEVVMKLEDFLYWN
ncbi:uncharacterized protein LOC124254856 [Haliotis rubra]|uniref:uncharacterized protein LOC124254856 n=1 Tax=Haliotis rubra TaxID=36100 RepID=UPI001EE59977|nr:uncharacterized protein LOC124254856 [Haliotis rubra]